MCCHLNVQYIYIYIYNPNPKPRNVPCLLIPKILKNYCSPATAPQPRNIQQYRSAVISVFCVICSLAMPRLLPTSGPAPRFISTLTLALILTLLLTRLWCGFPCGLEWVTLISKLDQIGVTYYQNWLLTTDLQRAKVNPCNMARGSTPRGRLAKKAVNWTLCPQLYCTILYGRCLAFTWWYENWVLPIWMQNLLEIAILLRLLSNLLTYLNEWIILISASHLCHAMLCKHGLCRHVVCVCVCVCHVREFCQNE